MEESVRWMYATGRDAFERKEFDEALAIFKKLTEKIDSFADVWNMMGQIHHDRGDFRGAIECFEKALAVNPRYTEVQFNLAVAYSEIGQYDKAEELYERVRGIPQGAGDKRIPDPFVRGKIANMHADLGDVYHGMGLFEDAIAEYEKALSMRPEFPDIRLRLAQALFDSGLKDEAIAELQAVSESRPDYLKARVQLGVFLYSTSKEHDAMEEWKEVLAQDPMNQLAKMYLRLAAKKHKW